MEGTFIPEWAARKLAQQSFAAAASLVGSWVHIPAEADRLEITTATGLVTVYRSGRIEVEPREKP